MVDNIVPTLDATDKISIAEIPTDGIFSMLMSNIGTKKIIYVDKTGSDTGTVGGPICPYLTIAKAIATAKTMAPSTNSPVGILIGPGLWTEQVIIDVAGISLYGWGQGITRLERAGTALIIRDNGVDTPPWDFKSVGISVKSTNAAEYSIDVQGIAGTNLGGNEIQFRDGRAEGTLSIRTNICNIIDYQNFYIMGKQLYQQTCGIWFEDGESNAEIKNDWDSTGDKPSDSEHYGLNFTRHWPKGAIVLLNDGIIGDDYRARKLGTDAGNVSEGNHNHEGTAVKSTGEAGGTKFLREDGDGTSSWQAPPSGTVAHSATTGQTTDDHHAKSHSHSAASGAGAIATDQIAKFGDGGVTNYAELQTSGKYRAYGTGRFKRVAYVFPTQMSVGGTYTFNANSYQVSTLVVIGTTDRPAMFRSFATGARQYCLAQLALPLDYVAGTDFDVVLACSANGSGNSMMNVGVLGTSDGESYDVAPTYQTLSAVALTGTYKRVSKVFTITGTNYNPGDCLSIVIMRNGLDGGDTLAVAMQLAGMGIRYISDKLGDDV